ncbi:MAG: AAA family ATPase [Acidobacteria bacterium]|nr:AAA family ATPase [Acidobacteriota bacterium]
MPPAQHEVDERTLRVLIVGSDPSLEDEFRVALSGIADTHGVLHFAETYRQALEIGRARQPRLIVIDVDRDVADIAGVSKELLEAVPGASVVAAFKLDQLEQNASESATIIELLRAQVRDFIRRPLSATELRVILDRLFSRVAPAAEVAQGRVVTFLSNKGGVGRSTLAVNVACGLAVRYPDEVLLIDASLQGGSCAWMLALKPQAGIVDVVRQKDRLDATLLRNLTTKHTSGLRLIAAPADALEGAEVDDEAIARLLSMARRSFRYVIVDTHATLDNVVMTALDLTDIAFVVVQGMAPAVAGVAKLLPVLEGLGLPPSRQRLVLNYNYQPFLGNLRPADIADRLQRTIEYVVPYEKRVLQSMNAGSPQVMQGGWWQRFGKTITELVDDLDGAGGDVAGAEAAPPGGRSRGKLDADDRGKGLLAGG